MIVKSSLKPLPSFDSWIQQFIYAKGRQNGKKFFVIREKKKNDRHLKFDSEALFEWYRGKQEEYEGLVHLQKQKR
jgi:hypothetical protein